MIKKIIGHNLFSWEYIEYDFSQSLTKVTSYNYDDNNKEGAGKSSLPNILTWIIYGQVPKENVKADDVIRHGAKKAAGELQFINGDKITRTRKPNSLSLWVNGEEKKGKDAKDTQKLIDDYVGMTFNTFCQTKYFPQDYKKKFITSNEEEKAKIISEIQNLQIFDKARDEVKGLLKQEKLNIATLDSELTTIKTLFDNNLDSKAGLEKLIKSSEDEKSSKIKNLTEKLKILAEKIELAKAEYAEKETNTLASEDKLQLENTLKTLEAEVLEKHLQINEIATSLKRKKESEKEHENKTNALNKLVDNLENINKKITQKNATLNLKLNASEPKIEDLAKEIKTLEEEVAKRAEVDAVYFELKSYIKSKEQEIAKISKEIANISNTGAGICDKCFQEISGEVLQNKIKALSKDKVELENEIKQGNTDLECIDVQRKEYEAGEKKVKALNLKLKDLQKAENENNILSMEIKSLNKEYSLIEQQKDKLQEELEVLNNTIINLPTDDSLKLQEEISQSKATITEIKEVLTKDLEHTSKLSLYKKEITNLEIQSQEVLAEKTEVEAQVPTELINELQKVTKKIQDSEIKLEEVTNLVKRSQEYQAQLIELKDSFKEVKSYVFQSVLAELTHKCNIYLQSLYDMPVELEFTNVVEGEMAKIQTKLKVNGEDQCLGLFSGGQSTRIYLATDLALAELVEMRGNSTLNGLRVFDEQMLYLSSESKEKVLNLFKNLKGSIFFIEHDELLDAIVDNILKIGYENGISRFE